MSLGKRSSKSSGPSGPGTDQPVVFPEAPRSPTRRKILDRTRRSPLSPASRRSAIAVTNRRGASRRRRPHIVQILMPLVPTVTEGEIETLEVILKGAISFENWEPRIIQ